MQNTTLAVEGTNIIGTHNASGERTIVAECAQPTVAMRLLLKCWAMNAARKYTAAARLLAEAEQLPAFKWINAPAPDQK